VRHREAERPGEYRTGIEPAGDLFGILIAAERVLVEALRVLGRASARGIQQCL
jgi:hypothetical protein